ncbi:hypothetical protein EDB81DRAFT_661255 [Dactylonectria macrodidyma]|uniref:Uncharacterized protein n=1 Tax=Dactylonectria macrodidyma TaxID=307937 RepID=A0A9P9DZ86_9HYPO|nr:hypothetical protein EDB81DRAFT_661255 [Dactylonectria macrodidyma]
MHSFLTLTSLVAAVAALDVQIVWRLEKSSNISALSVYNVASGDLLAETCGSLLEADVPIDFSAVNQNGLGNFTVGDESFLVHSNADFSGGPECSKTFNPDLAVVHCSKVTWSAKKYSKGDASECFEDADSYTVFNTIRRRDQTHEMHARGAPESSDLEERQYCSWNERSDLVGDGNPHQNFWHKQLSETISCSNAQSCSVGSLQSKSYTIGWSADASAAGWLSGGFSVSTSWTTGNTYTCTGGPGETLCIWYNTAHTAYTVQNVMYNTCGTSYTSSGPFVMYSPNENNRGGGYYCVIGTCRSQGDNYWDKTGRAGGP